MDIEKVQSKLSLRKLTCAGNQANPQRCSKFPPAEKQAQPE
jgi:hypothetical protein